MLVEPNAFAACSTIAAYTHGGAWLDELRAYVQANKDAVATYLEEHELGVRMQPSDATYLCWLDCHKIARDDVALCERIRKETGLVLSPGSQYGAAGRGFVRMNVGTHRELVDDGLRRLARALA